MATLIPSFASCAQRMTPGERRVAQRLNDKLEDDYLCWYNIPVGADRLHPDYVILHPQRGLLILEVKDWKLENIQTAKPDEFTILTIDGIKSLIDLLQINKDCRFGLPTMMKSGLKNTMTLIASDQTSTA